MSDAKQLNIEQAQAINHGDGPLLIIAGAGTGKTTVITERMKHLIVDQEVPSNKILALTFTEKAAKEMEERVDILLPYGYTDLWIHTFHSFCDRILRDEAHYIGIDVGYKLLSKSESILLLKNNLFDFDLRIFRPLGNPTKFLDALLTHFSRLKDEDITPNQYLEWAQSQDDSEVKNEYLELAHAYKDYEEIKMKNSVMDFSDLISNTLLLLRTKKHILQKYQLQFKYIFVDEFQDTNFAQNELAILLSGERKNITVVADDDQAIYRFRGAAITNVLQFKQNFSDAKIITLTQNYRSTQKILDASYQLIQHNNPNRLEVSEHINKKLVSMTKNVGDNLQYIYSQTGENEAETIASTIVRLTKKGYMFKDIAILVRANSHAQLITATLQRNNIPYQFLGPGYLFQQEEIKDLIAYLMFLTNLSDTVSLFRVLSLQAFDIPYVELNYLLIQAKNKNVSFFETLEKVTEDQLQPEIYKRLQFFLAMVHKHIAHVQSSSAGQMLYDFLVDSGIYATLQTIDSLEDEKRVKNIAKFFDRIKRFETDREDASIFTLVDYLNLMLEIDDNPTAADIDLSSENAVSISTVHGAKGLEFPVVFLVNLVAERFPSRERSEKIPLPDEILKEHFAQNTDFHTQEERRLFYVGMTRAKELLYFTGAKYYGEGKREKKISPFVLEATPDFLKKTIEKPMQQLSLSEILAPFEKKNHSEKDSPSSVYTVDYITYSRLQLFSICPMHYKAKVIFNLPTPKVAVQSSGISIHNTLYRFYKQVQENTIPTRKQLREMLQAEWINEGYMNKKDEALHMQNAQEIIDRFYKTDCHPPIKPLALELPFNFKLQNGVKVFGQIDRIDPNGTGIEIIDYKTGTYNEKAAKVHKEQLAIYALAATRIKDTTLHYQPEEITVTLYFLGDGTKKSMNFTKDDLDILETKLIKDIQSIESSTFQCSKSPLCVTGNCEYKMLCNPHKV